MALIDLTSTTGSGFLETDFDELKAALQSGTTTIYPESIQNTQFRLTSQTVAGSDGDLVHLTSATTWSQADADAEATCNGMLGIRVSASTVLTYGIYTTTGLTAGAIYYASTTAGGITTTAPSGSGDIVRIIGYALSTTELFVDPDKTYVEIA